MKVRLLILNIIMYLVYMLPQNFFRLDYFNVNKVTIEESVRTGSYTERLMAEAASRKLNYNFIPVTLPDSFIEHGSQKELWERYGFDAGKIAEKIKGEALLKLDAELFRR